MSYHTDIILITEDDEIEKIRPLNDYLDQYKEKLYQVNGFQEGGNRLSCCLSVWFANVNKLDRDEFMKVFYNIRWQWSEVVQLLLRGEQDDRFTVYVPDHRLMTHQDQRAKEGE